MTALILVLVTWEVYWTYHACWAASSAKREKVVSLFLVFNLLGIPEMLYLRRLRG